VNLDMGMPALIEFSSVEENALLCQELGLRFVELNMNMPYCFPQNLPSQKVRRLASELGLHFTMHMPDDFDLGSLHTSVRQGTLERSLEALDWAIDAELRLLNFHINPGIYFTLPKYRVWIFDKFYEQFRDNLVGSFSLLLDKANAHGVKLSVENVCNFDLPFIERVLDELVELKGFHLTWDVGHDAKTGNRERPVLMKHEDHLAHMHLHDYDGRTDHQVLFTGQIDIIGMVLFAQSHHMSVVLETKTIDSLVQSVAMLGKRFGWDLPS
jgi:sugar phosphate isomerase/epimerase